MNLYLSVYQLIKTADRLETGAKLLAANVFRVSPRDGMANREVLEECAKSLQTIHSRLVSKSHISKVQLSRTAVIFQALDTAHRRVLNLAGVPLNDDENVTRAIVGFLQQAQRDFLELRTLLGERMGVPVIVELPPDGTEGDFTAILQKESAFREELVKSIERGIEVFDEERELTEQLAMIRENLLAARKNMKQLLLDRLSERKKKTAIDQKIGIVPV
jgi:hypothetical protein